MKNLSRRVSRLERNRAAVIEKRDYQDLSDEELDRRIAQLAQVLFGDDTAAFKAFIQEELGQARADYLS